MKKGRIVGHSKSNYKFIYSTLYIALGMYLYILDEDAALMYLTILPIQFLFVLYGYRSKNLLLFILFIEMFLSQGINPVFFFLNRGAYSSTGFSAIGSYNFSVLGYFSAYSYIFVFCISLVLFDYLILKKRRKQDLLLPYFRDITERIQYYENPKYLTYMIIFTILMSLLSIWMYSNGIGVLGLNVVKLPFHLTGILVYFRKYIASLIILYFFFKCKPKSVGYIILIIYGVIMSVSGCSKSIAAITFFPLIFYYFVEMQHGKAIFALFIYGFIYIFVSASRSFVYAYSEVSYSFIDLISKSSELISNSNTNIFFSFLESISGRFYGSNVLVLMDQQNVSGFSDLVIWYLTGYYRFDILSMHGLSFDEGAFADFAFGVGVGLPGFIVLLSAHNYIFTIIQAAIIVLINHIFNVNAQKIVASRPKTIIMLIVAGLFGFFTQELWNGGPAITNAYLCVLGVILVRVFYVKKKKHFVFQSDKSL